MNYFCSSCNIPFSCNKALKRHYASKKHLCRVENKLKYVCDCGKSFTLSTNLTRHRKNCDQRSIPLQNNSSQVETLINENNEMKEIISKKEEEMRELKDEMDEMRKKVEMLFATSCGNTTTNNSTTHIENQNNIENQNVIIVNNFGNENTDYLTGQKVKNLIKNNAPFVCIPRLIQSIHFNPKHPENHNIKVTNSRDKHAKIFKDNKWVRAMKSRTIDDLIETICVFLEEKYEENKDFLSEFRQERFQEFYDKYGDQDKNTMKHIKDEVDITLINGSNEIHTIKPVLNL
jgi:hypothetical protein